MRNPAKQLERLLIDAREDPVRLETFFFQFIHHMMALSKEEVLSLSNQANELALVGREDYPKGIAFGQSCSAIYFYWNAEYEQSISHVLKAMEIFARHQDEEGMGFLHMMLGSNYRSMGDIELALKHFNKAIPKVDPLGPYGTFASYAYYNIGNLHLQAEDVDNSTEYFNKALAISEKLGDPSSRIRALCGLANLNIYLKNYDQVPLLLNKALKLNRKLKNPSFEARCYTDFSRYYLEQNQTAKALEFEQKSFETRQKANLKNGEVISLMNIGKILVLMEHDKKALKVLEEALDKSVLLKTKSYSYQIHLWLSELYEKAGDGHCPKALHHYKVHHQLKEEVFSDRAERRVRQMQVVHEVEATQKQNELLSRMNREISLEKEKSDRLLLNILPFEIARELKEKGRALPRHYPQVTVLFADFVGFTKIAEKLSAAELVFRLDEIFSAFDEIVNRHGLEKIKTIGDAYMCAGGIPVSNETNALDAVRAGLEIQKHIAERNREAAFPWELRCGIHTGPIIAGVVGQNKFAYDIWGDTVNIAARMESSGPAGKVNISKATFELIKDDFRCSYRGKIDSKNIGAIDMFLVDGPS